MTTINRDQVVSELFGDYHFRYKLKTLFRYLRDNSLTKLDITFPFIYTNYNLGILIYGKFSAENIEITEDSVILNVNVMILKDSQNKNIIGKEFDLDQFELSNQLNKICSQLQYLNPDIYYKYLFRVNKIYNIKQILQKYIDVNDSSIYLRQIDYLPNLTFSVNKQIVPKYDNLDDSLIVNSKTLFADNGDPFSMFKQLFVNPENFSDDKLKEIYNYLLDFNLLIKIENHELLKNRVILKENYNYKIQSILEFDLHKFNKDLNFTIKDFLYNPINRLMKFEKVDLILIRNLIKIYNCIFSRPQTEIGLLKIRDFSLLIKLEPLFEKCLPINVDELNTLLHYNLYENSEFDELSNKFFNLFTRQTKQEIRQNSIVLFDFDEFKWTLKKDFTIHSYFPITKYTEINQSTFKRYLTILQIFGKLNDFYDQLGKYVLLYS